MNHEDKIDKTQIIFESKIKDFNFLATGISEIP
jgi:hypothetical protein